MPVEYSAFAGWQANLKLVNDTVEVIVTLEVGPRIISYKRLDGPNVLKVVDEESGKSNEKEWKIRGGHRFWVGPEDFGKKESLTYAIDNSEVEHRIEGDLRVMVSHLTKGPALVRREMIVSLEQSGPEVSIEHRLTNQSSEPLMIAPWALTVMAPGGYAVIPQPQLGRHPNDYRPNRAIIAWPFTDLSDERLRLGRRMIRLIQKEGLPLKFGMRHSSGWVAYLREAELFVKSVPFTNGEIYPDLGSNFEAFTNSEFLELETLGPLRRVPVGGTVVHQELWTVFTRAVPPPTDDEESFLEWLEAYLTTSRGKFGAPSYQ